MAVTPLFSIIIASCEKLDYLRSCLRSIELLQSELSFEVIVVNDGSGDGTLDFLDSYLPPYPFLGISTENLGLASARNRGLEASSGMLVMVLDNDCIINRTVLEHLWKAFQLNPDAMFISTIAHVPIAKVPEVASSLMNNDTIFPLKEELLLRQQDESPLQRILRLVKTRLPELQAGWFGAQGPSICARRDLLLGLGGYDANLTGYGMEDFDLAFRFQEQRRELIWVSGSVIYHLDHGHNATRLFSEVAASTIYFYKKHQGLPQAKPFLDFLSCKISFRECNNQIAHLLGKPPCDAPELDINFSIYRMLEKREEQLHQQTCSGTPYSTPSSLSQQI